MSPVPSVWPQGERGPGPAGEGEPGRGNLFQINGSGGNVPTHLPLEQGYRKGNRETFTPWCHVQSGRRADILHILWPISPGSDGSGEQLIINCLLHVAFQVLAQIAQLGVLIPPAHWAMAGRPSLLWAW